MNSQLSPILNLYKKAGETPLQTLKRFKIAFPEYAEARLTYAGRLDPMAEGVLLVVVNDEIKHKDSLIALQKKYEVEILCGVETDTYDALGLVQEIHPLYPGQHLDTNEVMAVLNGFRGDIEQSYPPYSSKPLYGKPLFAHARAGTLDQALLPSHIITIQTIEFVSERIVSSVHLEQDIARRIALVKGDFRQVAILDRWHTILMERSGEFKIITIRVECSHGSYMRVLAHDVGQKLGYGAIAYGIKRLKIGNYAIEEALNF